MVVEHQPQYIIFLGKTHANLEMGTPLHKNEDVRTPNAGWDHGEVPISSFVRFHSLKNVDLSIRSGDSTIENRNSKRQNRNQND